MAYGLVDLGTITFSSGATASPAVGGIEDAEAITIAISSASTSSLTVQVELTSTGTTFKDLLNPASTAGTFYQAAASGVIMVSPVAFRQFRLTSTGAVDGATNINRAVKQYMV